MAKEQNNSYWRSLNELARNEEYKKFSEREFQENATELSDGLSRRNFIHLMGASVALAGLASCRKPVQKILPYTLEPEHVIPGVPLYYASAVPFRGNLFPVIVETHEGRPTKIEGNELDPDYLGKTGTRHQAAILDLYDQDRSRMIRHEGEASSREEFLSFCRNHFSERDRSVAFLCEASSSPTFLRLKNQLLQRFEKARWVVFEPFNDESVYSGIQQAFGERLRPLYHFRKARLVVSLDDNFMQDSDHQVAYIRDFARSKAIERPEDSPSRLYIAENNYSLTGSNADHRLRLKASEIPAFTFALAAELSGRTSGLEAWSGYSHPIQSHPWITHLASELLSHPGESIITAGSGHPPEVHAAVAAMNLALGNSGNTVEYLRTTHMEALDQNLALRELVSEMNNGNIDTLVMIGTNPLFTAPANLNFRQALSRVEHRIHLSSHYDETSRACSWHVHRTHFLENWSDGTSYTGTRSIIQPMIMPLFESISDIEFLHGLLFGEFGSGYEQVRKTWKEFLGDHFEQQWRRILHDGLEKNSRFPSVAASLTTAYSEQVRDGLPALSYLQHAGNEDIELVIKADPLIHDGRFANNGWLQELPDSMTKITWDNVALLSPNTAKRIGVPPVRKFGDPRQHMLRITSPSGTPTEIAAWVLPGHADNSITIYAGYGRTRAGRVGNGNGVDVFPLLRSDAPFWKTGVRVETTGETFEIASTQDHHSLEGRPHIREAGLKEYRANPSFASDAVYVPGTLGGQREHPISLFNDKIFPDYEPQWGMAIDLNACVGCGVCTIACQAENNIPVIGKREVRRGREMHWIRTDRYFSGDEKGNPKVLHQPVPCMHCENAPCEQVCPVAATTHSDDGLNQMTYSRCIGTRYCANNCPYKVRRFNYFNYAREFLLEGSDPEILQMAMNPDVSIRFRGVMEKCTYCIQRINRAKTRTKIQTGHSRKPADGMVETACQQACPANAIFFGDLTDEHSRVAQQKRKDRNYMMLEELNVRPRTSYLAKIRNPNENFTG